MERADGTVLKLLTPQGGPSRRRRTILLAVAIVLAIAVLGTLAYRYAVPAQPAFTAVRGPLVQTIAASGRVQAPQRVDIGTQITGTVAQIPVQEGQNVKAGDTLIVLDATEARAAVAQADAAVVQARAKLRQLREFSLPTAMQTLRQAEVNYQNVRRSFERSRQLHAQGFIGQAQLDDAQRGLDTAEAQLRAAQLQVRTNEPDGSDYHLAAAALEQAEAGLRVAQARATYTRIQAPVDGTLIDRNVERGDVVQPGKALMVLSPAGATQLVTQMDERNLARLRVGQKALASADAYPDQRFAAELVYINPGVDAQRGSIEVKFNVPQPPAYLRQDMTVSVDVEVARRDSAIVVPGEVLHDIASGAPWVWKVVDGRVHRQPVQVGVRDTGHAEILSGLQAGDEVLAGAAAKVREGQRVRAQPASGAQAATRPATVATPVTPATSAAATGR